jgi:hypothetical protein
LCRGGWRREPAAAGTARLLAAFGASRTAAAAGADDRTYGDGSADRFVGSDDRYQAGDAASLMGGFVLILGSGGGKPAGRHA